MSEQGWFCCVCWLLARFVNDEWMVQTQCQASVLQEVLTSFGHGQIDAVFQNGKFCYVVLVCGLFIMFQMTEKDEKALLFCVAGSAMFGFF